MRSLMMSMLLAVPLALSACATTDSAQKAHPRALVKPSVSGGLTPAQVQSSIEKQMEDLERVANKNWPGIGKVQVSFIVRPDGLPDSVELVRNDFQNPDLDLALTKMIKTLAFPPARSETFVKAFPLYFQ
jgi:outer membrane biosynthesis protein TonB